MLTFETGRPARWCSPLLIVLAGLAAGKSWGAEMPSGSTDPLLNLFIEKGYVTQEEAAKVKAEADQLHTNELANIPTPGSFWKMDTGVKSLELFGDVRMRYEDRSATDPGANVIDQQRLRYALHFGVRGTLFDDFDFGFRLETAANPRSPWVTLGTSSSTSGPYQGPFGKSTDGVNVGQLYLGWHREDWVNLEVGKLANPLYTTPMVWDSDLNPEGAAEQFKYTVGEADFFANLGQFLYADFNPNSVGSGLGFYGLTSGQNTQNIFMFAWQGGVNYHIDEDISAKIGATLYNYTGLERSSLNTGTSLSPFFGDPYVGEGAFYYAGGNLQGFAPGYAGYNPGTQYGQPGYQSSGYPFNQVGLNDLMIVEIPFEFNFKIEKKLAARIFGDFAYNLDGAQRAQQAASAYSTIINTQISSGGTAIPHSFAAQTKDVKAYQIGFGIGSTNFVAGPSQGVVYGNSSSRHAWEFRTYFQHIEQYSLDPNLIDSDFFEGRENVEGVYAAFAYNLSANVSGIFRYGYASRINNLIGTGGSNQDTPQMNPIAQFQVIQFDLSYKF